MRKPEDIQKEIDKLNLELAKSKEHHEYNLLCTDDWSDDMIGFFNMKKARIILTKLNEGAHLQIRHEACGTFNVYMNSQRNRISVEKVKSNGASIEIINDSKELINEDTIESFIIGHAGNWYIKN